MQITWIAALLALGLSEVASVSVLCQSNCESNLVHYKEEACEVWRSRLPRPDLYNNCGQGYILGKQAGCEGYCNKEPDDKLITSLRLDACSELQRVPPIDRQEACRAGFTAALDRARDVAVYVEDEPAASEGSGSKATPKRTVSAKRAPAGEPKNVLEQAREEAAAAFAAKDL